MNFLASPTEAVSNFCIYQNIQNHPKSFWCLANNPISCILKTLSLNFLPPKLSSPGPACQSAPEVTSSLPPSYAPALLARMNRRPRRRASSVQPLHFHCTCFQTRLDFPCTGLASLSTVTLSSCQFSFLPKIFSPSKFLFKKKITPVLSLLCHYSSQQEMGLPLPITLRKVSSNF